MTTDLLTPDDVAEALDCTAETVSAKLVARELPGVKIGRSWRIPRAALIEHLTAEALRNVRAKPCAKADAPKPAAVQMTATSPAPRRQPPKLVALASHQAISAAKSSPRSEA